MVALSSAPVKATYPVAGVATAQPTKRALNLQVRRYINVKSFGAIGDGDANDYPAILAAMNWQTATIHRGTLYFPKGTYKLSQSLVVTPNSVYMDMEGEPGTVITGDFNDFLVQYLWSDSVDSGVQKGIVERIKFVNTHATGGGLRIGTVVGSQVRDCHFSANRGLYASIDDVAWIPFEVSINNCHFDNGGNPTGSRAMLLGANGQVTNCTITGFDIGAQGFAGNGGSVYHGCRFELCGVGLKHSGVGAVQGCCFVNCGSAISTADVGSGLSRSPIEGIHIRASTGTIAGNPQYGFYYYGARVQYVRIAGMTITGEYAVAGAYFLASPSNVDLNLFTGMGITNTGAGVAWTMPTTGTAGHFLACNTKYVIATVPSGTNVATGTPNAHPGDEFNVANSNTAVWGATYAIGAPNNHVKIRYNGTDWTVVGK